MNDDEKQIAEALYGAIQDEAHLSERSLQAAEFKVGVSDLGFCSERTRRMLDQQVPERTDALKAWIGTALGDYAERAAARVWPLAHIQPTVIVDLYGEQRVYTLTGHPDIVLPEGKVLDVKTDYGLSTVERTGPTIQQQYQRHVYAKAAWDYGLFDEDVSLEDVQVGNVWIDRAAIDERLHVQMEPYDEGMVASAGMWLDDVVYAYLQGEEARKEPPRDMCAVVCGFYRTCRAYDTDVEGLITDPLTLTSVAQYREGLEMEKAGKRLKDQAKQHLVGVRGSTGEFMIRWTHVNETVVPETVRTGYDKIDVREIPKGKVKAK
jgi:hypothetical protein